MAVKIRNLWPRRAPGLPPGQREVSEFPRFSDQPLRWAPKVGPVQVLITSENGPAHQLYAGDLEAYGTVEQVSDFHCVTTWSYRDLHWGGTHLAPVLQGTLGSDLPPFARVRAGDSRSAVFLTEDLLESDVLLATHLDGEPLCRKHGAPLRLICPRQYGYKSAKHLTSIEFRHEQPASSFGSKEHLRGRVALEERHSKLPNWMLRVPYRLSIVPVALAAERGLRNSPT